MPILSYVGTEALRTQNNAGTIAKRNVTNDVPTCH